MGSKRSKHAAEPRYESGAEVLRGVGISSGMERKTQKQDEDMF